MVIESFVRAIDGDTLEVRIDDDPVGVGLIGIDASEGNTPCGQRAWDMLQALVAGGVRLVEQRGLAFDRRYRRLYHVRTLDGKLVATRLVRAGLARATGQGKHRRLLAAAQAEARKAKRGCLWSKQPSTRGSTPRGRLATREVAAATLPGGFSESVVAGGVTNPTAFAFLPDGRILVAEKAGVVKVVSGGAVLSTPLIDISGQVNDYWDRGLIGIAADPSFAANGYVYLFFTYENNPAAYSGFKTGRLARYTVVGNTASPATEQVILGTLVGAGCGGYPAGSDCIPSENPSHSVGNIKFASDGTMFVTSGDGASFNVVDDLALRAQSLDSLGGKVLHVTTTGAGVASNPFWNGDPNAARSKVWAYGFRNPFRLNLRPTGIPYVGDVGWQNWEEIDVATAGSNFGWPCYEGTGQQAGYSSKPTCQSLYEQGASAVKGPLVTYNHAGGGGAVVSGIFYTGTAFPAQYQGAFFYGDYVHGWIRTLTVDAGDSLTSGPTDFAPQGADGPVDIELGSDGAIYYISISTGQLRRIAYGGPAPPPAGTTYVSDLAWTSATNGWGPVETDRSNGEAGAGDGNVITLNGVTYQKGLGVHAVSSVKYYLGGTCQTFEADVGVDDEVGSNGSVQFRVYGDGVQLAATGTMTGTSATQTVTADVTGRVELDLSVGDAGNGKGYDHADWANARITCGGGSDTTPPTVTGTTPGAGATGVATNASPTATFSEAVQASTVTTSTFTLVDQATQTPVAAAVTYDAATRTATLDPSADLAPSTAYVATVKGGPSGVKDLAGNALAQDYVWTFTTGTGAPTTTYLSDMTWTSATNGWGPVERDTSNGEQAAGDGRTITLNGVTYQKGLGVHALSDVLFDLAGGCISFEASVGVDDEVGGNGSLIFRVYGDGALLYDSGAMTGATATKTVNVSVAGVAQLRLNVDPNGVKSYDHADWASARVTCGGSVNAPPVPTIGAPAPGLLVSVGDVVQYSGSATDPEDGVIDPATLSWQVNINHCTGGTCHVHILQTGTGAGGSFTTPDHDDDVYFEIVLTATDSGNQSASTSMRVDPRTVQITLATSPTGLQVVYGGQPGTAPMTVTAMVGGTRTIFAPSPQGASQFVSWSDGGAQQHDITIGTSNATYTATFSGGSSGTTYLSDMTWTSAINGLGPVERDMSNGGAQAGDGNTITLNGVTYAKGLGTNALSDIRFDLAGACTRFQANVGIDDEVGLLGTVTFRVYADGSLRYGSGRMTGSSATRTIDIDITGVTELQLYVDPGSGPSNDHADWAYARVTCSGAGGGDSTAPTVTQSVPTGGATGVETTASPTATFSEPLQGSTVTTATFTVVNQATQTPVAAAVTYNAGTSTATLDPSANLSPSSNYVATVKGGASGVKDLAGNALAQDYVWTFTTASGGTPSGLFGAPAPYAVGTNPHGVVAADVNADGKRDLVVANAGGNSVSVLLGNGNGTFGAASTFATGTRPKSAAVADLNGDGKPDLVSANQNANSVSVLLGNGDGTFQPKVDYGTCSKAHEVAVGDVSGDGRRDLAVACWDGSVIDVLLGNGDGTFAAATSYGAGSAPHSIVIEDFNADGKGDLAVANHSSNNVSVLLGNGDGTFQATANYTVGSRPHSVRAGDLNGDGRLDLVTANDGSDNVSVLLGNGDGTFQAATYYAAGKVPKSVAIADLDGDGKQDVVTANTAGNGDGVTGNPDGDNVSVLLGTGSGALGVETKYTVGLTPFSVFVADLNGDGKPDLTTANWDANTTAVLLHT
jgi:glucose/arabinose dehydrogenase